MPEISRARRRRRSIWPETDALARYFSAPGAEGSPGSGGQQTCFDLALTMFTRPVGSGLNPVERLQDLPQQVEVMAAQVHGPDLDAPREGSLLQGRRQSFHLVGLPDADDFNQFHQLRLQTLSRGWGSPSWHVSSMGRITPRGELGGTLAPEVNRQPASNRVNLR